MTGHVVLQWPSGSSAPSSLSFWRPSLDRNPVLFRDPFELGKDLVHIKIVIGQGCLGVFNLQAKDARDSCMMENLSWYLSYISINWAETLSA